MKPIASNACRVLSGLSPLVAAALLSGIAPVPALAEGAPALSVTPQAPGALALEARGLDLPAPASRVYRSVGPDGRVVFADRPEPGARTVVARSFASSSDPQALETARRRQAYWRAQAEAFEARRQEREQAEAAEARARSEAMAAAASPALVLVVPRHLRAPAWQGPMPGPAYPGRYPAVYPSSPGAAAQVPAAFISSGFATGR